MNVEYKDELGWACKWCGTRLPSWQLVQTHACREKPMIHTVNKPSAAMQQKLSKPPMSLIPKVLMEETAKAFGDGATKHGIHAYKTGNMTVLQALSAALRHLEECIEGEDVVPDSASMAHHLGAVGAEIGIALWLIKNRRELDDRFKKETTAAETGQTLPPNVEGPVLPAEESCQEKKG